MEEIKNCDFTIAMIKSFYYTCSKPANSKQKKIVFNEYKKVQRKCLKAITHELTQSEYLDCLYSLRESKFY